MKVAAYCRVSTEYEDQTNSFETQKRFFKEHIERNPDWELYEIYADEGLSGTSTENRPGFNRMIEDAKAGKFDLILTKEVSRFARNTVDTLHYTRDLKRIGVGVMFMNDRINSMNPEAEFVLALMASMVDHITCYPDRTMEANSFLYSDDYILKSLAQHFYPITNQLLGLFYIRFRQIRLVACLEEFIFQRTHFSNHLFRCFFCYVTLAGKCHKVLFL